MAEDKGRPSGTDNPNNKNIDDGEIPPYKVVERGVPTTDEENRQIAIEKAEAQLKAAEDVGIPEEIAAAEVRLTEAGGGEPEVVISEGMRQDLIVHGVTTDPVTGRRIVRTDRDPSELPGGKSVLSSNSDLTGAPKSAPAKATPAKSTSTSAK